MCFLFKKGVQGTSECAVSLSRVEFVIQSSGIVVVICIPSILSMSPSTPSKNTLIKTTHKDLRILGLSRVPMRLGSIFLASDTDYTSPVKKKPQNIFMLIRSATPVASHRSEHPKTRQQGMAMKAQSKKSFYGLFSSRG